VHVGDKNERRQEISEEVCVAGSSVVAWAWLGRSTRGHHRREKGMKIRKFSINLLNFTLLGNW
jgi:hypothetical protein